MADAVLLLNAQYHKVELVEQNTTLLLLQTNSVETNRENTNYIIEIGCKEDFQFATGKQKVRSTLRSITVRVFVNSSKKGP